MTGLFVAANFVGTTGKGLPRYIIKGQKAKIPEEKEKYDFIPSAIAKEGIYTETEPKAISLAGDRYRYRIIYAILIGFS